MQYHGRVRRFSQLTSSVFEVVLESDRRMDFRAGQYISLVVPVEGGKPLRRPYSIASPPEDECIELCVQKIEAGPGSGYLASLKEGDTIEWFGPYGFLVYHPKPARQCLFVATGTGIAPLRSILLSAEFRDQPPAATHVLMGVRTEADLLYSELGQIVDLKWIPCISKSQTRSEKYYSGRVTEYLRHEVDATRLREIDFYLCGNGAMIDEVKHFLKERGVEKTSIHQEIYFRPPKASIEAQT